MQINLLAKEITIGAPLRSYLDRKVQKLERLCHDTGDIIATVELDYTRPNPRRKGEQFRCEMNLDCRSWGVCFRAEATGINPEAAIDLVEEEIERQILRRKGKTLTARRRQKSA